MNYSYEKGKLEGLSFTGIYSSGNKEEVKQQAKEIRQKYKCRAVVVSKSNGYKVYADEKYFEMEELERAERILSFEDETKKKMYERYMSELNKYEQECKRKKEYIDKIKNKYGL